VKAGWPMGSTAAKRDAPKAHLRQEEARRYAERWRQQPPDA
jgi:hypothetical protein